MAFLPLDILPIILSHLTIPDIYRVRLVCREYRLLTKTRSLWFAYIQRYFLRHNISIPGLHGRPLETLDAQELETLTLKAERYKRNWLSGAQSPKPTRHVEFIAVPDSRIIALKFLSRNGENWLFSLAMTRNHGMRAFTFQCWDLKLNPPVCIARRILHHFAGMAFNKLETGRAVVAVKTPEICLIDIDTGGAAGGEPSGKRASVGDSNSTRHPAQACVNVANLDDRAVGTLMLLGDLVLAQDNAGRSFLYHFESPQIRVQLIDPEGNAQPEIILDVLVDRGWLILARTKTVELYQLPASIDHNTQIEPIARHTWQWKVDSIVLAPLVNNTKNSTTPIQIVIRTAFSQSI
ncbi:hypothetical protein AGABI2DRAFT_143530 [Agaricus bisporus var. bisporus H97]|uniref:hypothetical protein n=1 Tax=Agaricus bisporus var. bisporus (strain H97 / ATCC MYA-4626 / FGSC 10389) TaxID=936046 RepID=UPI00029F6E17|nr:hypothetical protein AGABI2DRAFT_143530 [Agaricus bisporus var. bisporus H97]EKV46404.1 hypothetical protein AGABI2DRAFT_143530 [Agaricus bisporus var. bisporus H97]